MNGFEIARRPTDNSIDMELYLRTGRVARSQHAIMLFGRLMRFGGSALGALADRCAHTLGRGLRGAHPLDTILRPETTRHG